MCLVIDVYSGLLFSTLFLLIVYIANWSKTNEIDN